MNENVNLTRKFNPLNDFLFYKVMGEKGSEPQLIGFLNAVLCRSGRSVIESLEILEKKTFVKDLFEGKSCTLDVRATLSDKTKVNIEVQLDNEYNMDRRSLFYWSKLYIDGFEKGGDYRELPDVIAVNIVNFCFPKDGSTHTCFRLREETDPKIILTTALEIHFVSMIKYKKQMEKKMDLENPLNRWLAWFDTGSPPELAEEVIGMDSAIMAANEKLELVMQDEAARELYEMQQKAEWDWTSGLNGARREGKLEIARNALVEGISIDLIQKITGLEFYVIQGLQTENG